MTSFSIIIAVINFLSTSQVLFDQGTAPCLIVDQAVMAWHRTQSFTLRLQVEVWLYSFSLQLVLVSVARGNVFHVTPCFTAISILVGVTNR